MLIDIRLYAAELDGVEVQSAEELGTVLNEWLYKYLDRLPEITPMDMVDVLSSTNMLMMDEETGCFLFTVTDGLN